MKQTAVEWMANELLYLDNEFDMGIIIKTEYQIKRKSIIGKAKAMEKEQKIKFAFDFYYDFSNQLGVPFNLISENRLNAEQYYNETFKSE